MIEIEKRDPRAETKRSFVIQLALAIPFLLIFGWSVTNIILTILFLALAGVRMRFPYSEHLRRVELWGSIILGVGWLLLQVW